MKCALCGFPLLGMSDSRIYVINRVRALACADLQPCRDRQRATYRAARGLEPEPRKPVIEMPRRTP